MLSLSISASGTGFIDRLFQRTGLEDKSFYLGFDNCLRLNQIILLASEKIEWERSRIAWFLGSFWLSKLKDALTWHRPRMDA
jgi:hypothetical protein